MFAVLINVLLKPMLEKLQFRHTIAKLISCNL